MGESPATYAHADAVAALTKRIRQTHAQALAHALERMPAISAAFDAGEQEGLRATVAAFEQLVTTDLAGLRKRHTIANEVLTAAFYIASGITYMAVSVRVHQVESGPLRGQYRVEFFSGSSGRDTPVRDYPPSTGEAAR